MMKVSTVDHGTTMVHNWPFVSQIIHHDGFVQYSSWSQMYTNLSLPIYRSAGMHRLCVQPNFQQTKVFHHIRIPHSEILHIVVQQCAEIASEPVNTEETEERGGCGEKLEYLLTSTQSSKQEEISKAEATFYPLWSVDSRGAGQFYF